jgi:hypothetical protein
LDISSKGVLKNNASKQRNELKQKKEEREMGEVSSELRSSLSSGIHKNLALKISAMF